MRPSHVTALRTFPVKDQPGRDHSAVDVEPEGLAGDRRKKAAVSIVGNDSPATRANIVLDVPSTEVESLVGSVVRIGEALLAIERTAGSCPGVYAAVGRVGVIRTGDPVLVAEDVHPQEG
jgi:uncharacterized protein YcbX